MENNKTVRQLLQQKVKNNMDYPELKKEESEMEGVEHIQQDAALSPREDDMDDASRGRRRRNSARSTYQVKSDRKRETLQDMARPLKHWIYKNRRNPYPTREDKLRLAQVSGMSSTQVSNWFANARRRLKSAVKEENITWSRRIKLYNATAERDTDLLESLTVSAPEPDVSPYSTDDSDTEPLRQPEISGPIPPQFTHMDSPPTHHKLHPEQTSFAAHPMPPYHLAHAAMHSTPLDYSLPRPSVTSLPSVTPPVAQLPPVTPSAEHRPTYLMDQSRYIGQIIDQHRPPSPAPQRVPSPGRLSPTHEAVTSSEHAYKHKHRMLRRFLKENPLSRQHSQEFARLDRRRTVSSSSSSSVELGDSPLTSPAAKSVTREAAVQTTAQSPEVELAAIQKLWETRPGGSNPATVQELQAVAALVSMMCKSMAKVGDKATAEHEIEARN